MLKKKIFVPRLRIWEKLSRKRKNYKCKNCGIASDILFSDFIGSWRCRHCDYEQYLPSFIGEEFKKDYPIWSFRKSDLFTKNNELLGAIPVILTLLVFKRILDTSSFIYLPSLNLEIKNKPCEIDFCVLKYRRMDKIQFGFGECKDEGGIIDQRDVDNLLKIKEKIDELGMNSYIVFSKTADQFNPKEIDLFRSLINKDIPIILLTNKELEPYNPYHESKDDKLPYKYAVSFEEMARNSQYIYLKK